MSSDEKNVRHRFTVPTADTKVNEWIENQSNLGFSLRVLIKSFVREYGYQDATCLEFGTEIKKRGRPPKSIKDQVDTMYDNEVYESEMSDVETALPKPEMKQEVKQKPTPVKSEEVDIEDLLSGSNPVSTPSNTNINTDDDGFVDPESLF